MNATRLRPYNLAVTAFVSTLYLATSVSQAALLPPTTVSSATQSAYAGDVSNSDLLHGLLGTTSGTAWQSTPGALNDGVHGADTGATFAWAQPGSEITYDLGLGTSGFGWDITSIQSIAAWNSAGFWYQGYTIDVRVKDSAIFTSVATVQFTPGGALASKVTLNDDTGVLASNVEFLKFTHNNTPGANAGRVTYRELDAFGSESIIDIGGGGGGDIAGVIDGSFEDTNISNGNFLVGSTPDWTAVNAAGIQDFSSQSPIATDGEQHAFVNGGATFHQATDNAITEGTTYVLSVDVGQITNFSGSLGTIRLFGSDDGYTVALAELTNIAPDSGIYLKDQMVTFTALASHDTGQTLGIALIGQSGTQVLFDNVRLTIVPEPRTFALAALGLLGLVAFRLRRRR